MTRTDAQPTRILQRPTPKQLVAIIDTREQVPLNLSPLQTVRDSLDTGDYSIRGLEPIVMAENHERAGRVVGRLLYIAARRRWREARALVSGVIEDEAA